MGRVVFGRRPVIRVYSQQPTSKRTPAHSSYGPLPPFGPFGFGPPNGGRGPCCWMLGFASREIGVVTPHCFRKMARGRARPFDEASARRSRMPNKHATQWGLQETSNMTVLLDKNVFT